MLYINLEGLSDVQDTEKAKSTHSLKKHSVLHEARLIFIHKSNEVNSTNLSIHLLFYAQNRIAL